MNGHTVSQLIIPGSSIPDIRIGAAEAIARIALQGGVGIRQVQVDCVGSPQPDRRFPVRACCLPGSCLHMFSLLVLAAIVPKIGLFEQCSGLSLTIVIFEWHVQIILKQLLGLDVFCVM